MRQGGQGSTAPTAPDGKDPGRNEFIQLSRVPYVDFTFGRLPMAPFLGRYAGGSDIQLVKDAQSGMLASLEVSNVRLPQGARDRIQACLGKGYEASSHMARLFNLRANGGAGVTDPTRPLLWSHNLLVTRPPRGELGPAGGDKRICNAILTGWIYPRGLTPSGAAGNHLQGSVPLAGVFAPRGIGLDDSGCKTHGCEFFASPGGGGFCSGCSRKRKSGAQSPASRTPTGAPSYRDADIGLNELRPAYHDVHDGCFMTCQMGKFMVKDAKRGATGLLVAVDPRTHRGAATLLVVLPEAKAPAASGPWTCSACTFENKGGSLCEMCSTPRPASVSGFQGGAASSPFAALAGSKFNSASDFNKRVSSALNAAGAPEALVRDATTLLDALFQPLKSGASKTAAAVQAAERGAVQAAERGAAQVRSPVRSPAKPQANTRTTQAVEQKTKQKAVQATLEVRAQESRIGTQASTSKANKSKGSAVPEPKQPITPSLVRGMGTQATSKAAPSEQTVPNIRPGSERKSGTQVTPPTAQRLLDGLNWSVAADGERLCPVARPTTLEMKELLKANHWSRIPPKIPIRVLTGPGAGAEGGSRLQQLLQAMLGGKLTFGGALKDTTVVITVGSGDTDNMQAIIALARMSSALGSVWVVFDTPPLSAESPPAYYIPQKKQHRFHTDRKLKCGHLLAKDKFGRGVYALEQPLVNSSDTGEDDGNVRVDEPFCNSCMQLNAMCARETVLKALGSLPKNMKFTTGRIWPRRGVSLMSYVSPVLSYLSQYTEDASAFNKRKYHDAQRDPQGVRSRRMNVVDGSGWGPWGSSGLVKAATDSAQVLLVQMGAAQPDLVETLLKARKGKGVHCVCMNLSLPGADNVLNTCYNTAVDPKATESLLRSTARKVPGGINFVSSNFCSGLPREPWESPGVVGRLLRHWAVCARGKSKEDGTEPLFNPYALLIGLLVVVARRTEKRRA